MHMFNWSYGGHVFRFIMMVIFWALVIFGVVYLIKNINTNNKGYTNEDPKEIARQRYAKGEIDKDELDEILNNLNKRR
ncbi:SHOCT domain-containing protein [Natronospora cellulosivora (SeqCode)]